MNRRAVLFWGGLALVLIVAGFAAGRRASDGDPLDPDSTGPLGTHGLVTFVERFGAEVARDLPDGAADRALLLSDRLNPDQRDELDRWVDAGGTLVVADPASPFAPGPDQPILDTTGSLEAGTCTLPGLGGLTIAGGSFLRYPSADADGRCFGDDEHSFVHITQRGQGRVVAIGGGLAFTNRHLDEADNAVLVAELLVPSGGTVGGTIRPVLPVLYDPVFTPGSRSLADLIPAPVKWSAWQLLVAFVLYALLRGRRFGRPVTEPQPVELPGSLLVRATAELHRRTGGHAHASAVVRRDLDRRLRQRLKAPPDLPPPELARWAAGRAGLDQAVVQRAVLGPPAHDGTTLAAQVCEVDAVNRALAAADTDPPRDRADRPPAGGPP